MAARQRLREWATRQVYGERSAPDEVLRTFGSRLTRALPLDELLLQLAESLKKTMSLSIAETRSTTPASLAAPLFAPGGLRNLARPSRAVVDDSVIAAKNTD